MRMLYDTNILVGILSRKTSVLAFKESVTKRRLKHITSAYILQEVEAVLSERMGLTKQKAKAAARLLARHSLIAEPTTIEQICRDPFDDYILAAALAGQAEYVVTADKDLLVLETYRQIPIITPSAFAALFHL